MKRRLWTVAGLVALAIFATFVWPSRYRYFAQRVGSGTVTMRVDRFSDRTWRLTNDGWKPLSSTPSAHTASLNDIVPDAAPTVSVPAPVPHFLDPIPPQKNPTQELSSDDIKKLTVPKTTMVYGGPLSVNVYNETDFIVSEVTLQITARDGEGNLISNRQYHLSGIDGLHWDAVFTSEKELPHVSSDEMANEVWFLKITGAKGYKP